MGGHELPIDGPWACSRHGGAAHGARRGSLHRGLYLDDRVTHAMAAMRRHGGRSTAFSDTASHAGPRRAASASASCRSPPSRADSAWGTSSTRSATRTPSAIRICLAAGARSRSTS
jgi:hypothetical protein